MSHILKCGGCNSYGMTEICSCGKKRIPVKPPKYGPEDRYGRYRREYKKLQDKGL